MFMMCTLAQYFRFGDLIKLFLTDPQANTVRFPSAFNTLTPIQQRVYAMYIV